MGIISFAAAGTAVSSYALSACSSYLELAKI